MKAPKCRTCGEDHRTGPCPKFMESRDGETRRVRSNRRDEGQNQSGAPSANECIRSVSIQKRPEQPELERREVSVDRRGNEESLPIPKKIPRQISRSQSSHDGSDERTPLPRTVRSVREPEVRSSPSSGIRDRAKAKRSVALQKTSQESSSIRRRGPPKGTGGRPRIGTETQTAKHLKPWLTEGISERTWYRRQAEKRT